LSAIQNPLINIPGGGIAVNILGSVPVLGAFLQNGFRPPNWSYRPQLWSLTAQVPTTQTANVQTVISSGGGSAPTGGTSTPQTNFRTTTYFFDAVMRSDHSEPVAITRLPVQNGAAMTDHAYLLPPRIILEVGMSDAYDSFVQGQYSGAGTKSISFYRVLQTLRQQRLPMQLTTRLSDYENVMLEEIRASDDVRTLFGFKGTLIFTQIYMGIVQQGQTNSARPDANNTSNPGAESSVPVPQSLNNYQNPDGTFSSNPLESQS
jgi:hypothetical protein